MAIDDTGSNRSSLVSLDPTVVSHITGTRSVASGHTRTGSTPVKPRNFSTPIGYTRGHGRTNSAPPKNGYKRSNSLRRAKNSTEILRQNSKRAAESTVNDQPGDNGRGRNFTVTSVGVGGTLHLAPSAFQLPLSTISQPPLTAPPTVPLIPSGGVSRKSSVVLRTRSVSPKRLLGRLKKAKDSKDPFPIPKPPHKRSQSFSTLDESRRSLTSSWPKTLKIIINRVEGNRPQPADVELKPSLEIPIPHYRLGIPRFSIHGTPILRNSVFSRTSSTSSIKRNSSIKNEAHGSAPPPASLKAFAKIQAKDPAVNIGSHTEIITGPKVTADDDRQPSRPSSIGYAPSIYDELNEVYNDSSVVRFAHDVRDVTAATPARIIAQISSESFMDYELVSDFFLTFRSYMSTQDVLDLLLARLAWAIGRMSDDGRIIRIRTFAALRHWILNYFMDDFVPDRHLRLRFCEEVNDLYDEVKSRTTGGASDLKILQDLKRCWNGRCSLYWDGDCFDMDSFQENELHPGGVIGSRNPYYTNIDEIEANLATQDLPAVQSAPVMVAQMMPPKMSGTATTHQAKTMSHVTAEHAESLNSEQSIQPQSCTALYSLARSALDGHSKLKKSHPLSVLERRQKAPSDLKVQTGRPSSQQHHHKRGGNSFDSTRERTPNIVTTPISKLWVDHQEGSVIRGFAYAPVEPFVHIPPQIPQSPSGPSGPYTQRTDSRSTKQSTMPEPQLNGPTVKNVFGSIRRALSGKQGSNELTYITISGPQSNVSLQRKRSFLPLSISKSSDELRKRVLTAPPRSPVRIDLLSAAAVESYQAIQPADGPTPIQPVKTEVAQPGELGKMAAGNLDIDRIQSRITSRSGSIVIVDDTGPRGPAMSGALGYPQSPTSESSGGSFNLPISADERPTSYETQIAFEGHSNRSSVEQNQRSFDSVQKLEPENASEEKDEAVDNLASSTASTTTVKNRQSLSSSVVQPRPLTSAGETASTTTQSVEGDVSEDDSGSTKHPTQTLRRRPGGDLRKNQNVHDLESAVTPHHESLDSLVDSVSTPTESLLTMRDAGPVQPYVMTKDGRMIKPDISRVSMINTHSSQHLRPSFEAAVSGFSAIPDDADGGLEATLLKLEGRYEKTPDLDNDSRVFAPLSARSAGFPLVPYVGHSVQPNVAYRGYLHSPAGQVNTKSSQEQTLPVKQLSYLPETNVPVGLAVSLPPSAMSQTSIPLLQRSSVAPSADDKFSLRNSKADISHSDLITSPRKMQALTSSNEEDTISTHSNPRMLDSRQYQHLRPETSNTERSFLLDEDEDFSDLSSEISVDVINYSEAMGDHTGSPILVAPGTAISGLEIPSHPLAHSSLVNIAMPQGLALDGIERDDQLKTLESSSRFDRSGNLDQRSQEQQNIHQKSVSRLQNIPVGPAHVPFILACDSQVLAQQLTLIEQSALTEVEWSDLINMKWSKNPAQALDWAEYVTQPDLKGVDLVITRFNLMVKWALSEIVLTQNIDERARVITKLIHVAAHARRLHNYATMLQVTIALTSTDCTRLAETWQKVPEPDRSLLSNMESLIQPVRNFHDLRVEMESADMTDGCIPFIGLYVHDLTYNAQKPSEIDAGKNRTPLINFERFRTTAIIVKGLLRLIDASAKYEFEPINGIIQRCLWIASLDDERIRSLSKTLEVETSE